MPVDLPNASIWISPTFACRRPFACSTSVSLHQHQPALAAGANRSAIWPQRQDQHHRPATASRLRRAALQVRHPADPRSARGRPFVNTTVSSSSLDNMLIFLAGGMDCSAPCAC